MLWRYLLIQAVVLLLASSTPAQSSGILLGLRRSECVLDDCGDRYRTLWIARQPGSVKLVAELPDLVVPRRDGFFRVGTRNYCARPEDWSVSTEDVYFAVPVHERPVIKNLISCGAASKLAKKNFDDLKKKHKKNGDDADDFEVNNAESHGGGSVCQTSSATIEFINPDYVSVSRAYSVECGAHPDGSISVHVSTLGAPSKSIAFSSMAKIAGNVYRLRAKRALIDNANGVASEDDGKGDKGAQFRMDQDLKALAEESNCFPQGALDDSQWSISRKNGRWMPTGAVSIPRICNFQVTFDLPSGFLAQLGIRESVSPDLKIVQKTIANARDAFRSPRNDLLVVLAGSNSLLVLDPAGANPGAPLLSLLLKPDEMPVMAEWAFGAGAVRWTEQLREIEGHRLAEPVLAAGESPKP